MRQFTRIFRYEVRKIYKNLLFFFQNPVVFVNIRVDFIVEMDHLTHPQGAVAWEPPFELHQIHHLLSESQPFSAKVVDFDLRFFSLGFIIQPHFIILSPLRVFFVDFLQQIFDFFLPLNRDFFELNNSLFERFEVDIRYDFDEIYRERQIFCLFENGLVGRNLVELVLELPYFFIFQF